MDWKFGVLRHAIGSMKQTIQLGTLSAVNIGIAFLFQWYVLTQLGPGVETDSLFAGMTLPQLALAVISGSLMHVLVPLLTVEEDGKRRNDAWAFLILVTGLFSLIAVILYLAAPWWIPLTVPGFDAEGRALAIELTRIQLVGMVFAAINGVQWAAYHARQQFIWAEFTPILASSLGLLLLIWALPRFGVIAAAWISTLRLALQTVLLAPGMGKPVKPNFRSVAVIEAWRRIKPLLVGTSYYKTEPLVDRFLLSTAGSGGLSLYYLAQQIYGAANQIVNKAIAAPLVPQLSKLNAARDGSAFWRAYRHRLWQVCALGVVGLAVVGVFGRPMLEQLVAHGNVSAENVERLWLILLSLGGMFIGGAMGMISSSSFYSMGDTRTPTRLGMLTYTLFIPAKIVAIYVFGIPGLALVTSMYYAVNVYLQDRQLKRRCW